MKHTWSFCFILFCFVFPKECSFHCEDIIEITGQLRLEEGEISSPAPAQSRAEAGLLRASPSWDMKPQAAETKPSLAPSPQLGCPVGEKSSHLQP